MTKFVRIALSLAAFLTIAGALNQASAQDYHHHHRPHHRHHHHYHGR